LDAEKKANFAGLEFSAIAEFESPHGTMVQVYDPIRDRTIRFNSEEEVRYWLDKCYYTR
jgi:hypothetical protein